MTALTETITKRLMESIKPETAKQYIRRLQAINHDRPVKSLAFLRDTKTIIDRIESLPLKDNSKQVYYATVVGILKLYPRMKKIQDEYRVKMDEYLKKVSAHYASNEKTEKEKVNMITYDEVVKHRETLTDAFDYMVLALYTMFPPRRNADYCEMYFVIDDKYKLGDKNYFLYHTKEFVFNRYKTDGRYNQQRFPVPQELCDVIAKYMVTRKEIQSGDKFLVGHGKSIDSSQQMTQLLNRIFFPLGKKISSTMLRHIYVNSLDGEGLEKRKEVAEKMAHSVGMNFLYQKK